MKYYYLFDDDGYVFSERQTNSPLIPTDPWYNHPRVKEFDHILVSDKVRLVDNKIVSAQKPEPDVSYDFNRRRAYPSIARQLEMLADDIEAGFFGNQASQGSWFKSIQTVKEKYPK
jgi:hypothetical protein